ncbi:unnamed protein product [Paramecium pentaurelia]|uniref:Uncharacterized protein n=1 Tax=Paramecium pentaurelia TaxID=43138 RepID=A0A8S1YMW0_9CILI|nr:unnamed protein product [Paramecium pentaurelia]
MGRESMIILEVEEQCKEIGAINLTMSAKFGIGIEYSNQSISIRNQKMLITFNMLKTLRNKTKKIKDVVEIQSKIY